MNTREMIEKISEKDFDVDAFVQLALRDDDAREEIVRQMVTNPHIMVYYHCYYVVSKASQKQPGLFYEYWDAIAELINHRNSYHRDFAITIIGNLTQVDQENRFADIEDDYFALVNDEKFMTGNCCVQNIVKIYRHKDELREKIIALLLDIDNRCDYTPKQKALLKCDVLEIFDEIRQVREKDEIDEFIRAQVNSISPKTRKKAKELVKKYSL
jgi:hypothetical protein